MSASRVLGEACLWRGLGWPTFGGGCVAALFAEEGRSSVSKIRVISFLLLGVWYHTIRGHAVQQCLPARPTVSGLDFRRWLWLCVEPRGLATGYVLWC